MKNNRGLGWIYILGSILCIFLILLAVLFIKQSHYQNNEENTIYSSISATLHKTSEPKMTIHIFVTSIVPTSAKPSQKPVEDYSGKEVVGYPKIVATDGRPDPGEPFIIDNLVLINRKHQVNFNYAPKTVSVGGGVTLQPVAAEAFIAMRKAAEAEGVVFYPRSGYRSFDSQVKIHNSYIATDPEGERGVDRYSAPPGASEHQSGLAIDIDSGNGLSYDFDKEPAGRWIHQNAYKYGFILRFPQGKEGITGYRYEPWHFRYVGKEIAEYFHKHQGLTLEEYLKDGPAPSPYYEPANSD